MYGNDLFSVFLFRQNCGWSQLTISSSDGLTGDAGRCSLSESRFSINSVKHPHRQSNYRSPSANQFRVSQRRSAQQNSQRRH